MQKVSKLVATLTLAASLILAPIPQAGAITVIDPTNLAQNILQATRALEQINNQIRQIEQQAQMLTRNPLQLSPELQQSISQARQLFTSAQGLTFQVRQRTQQWLSQDRAAVENSMQAESRAAESIAAMQGRIDQALQSSANAEGQ